jgi:hypothetical protein
MNGKYLDSGVIDGEIIGLPLLEYTYRKMWFQGIGK